MAAKIFRINYKSDFILTMNSDAGWAIPFCIKFWTSVPSRAYFVGFDGTTYTHCAYDPSEPTKLVVQFDDHHLPIGDLNYQIAYHFTVADFPNDTEDEVINPAAITTEIDGETYHIMLDFTGETAPEIEFSLPAYANEQQRISNEQQRVSQEAERVSEYAELKQDAIEATQDANAAATSANNAATNATNAAASANQAAIGAENVDASLNGNVLSVTNRAGQTTSKNVQGQVGPQGQKGDTGNGIASTVLNSDYTLTITFTNGTTYTTPPIRGAQGEQGVSVIGFTQTGETATNTMYNLVFSDGRTQSVAIPKGVKGDKGDTGDDGNVGPQGAQGPKGDTVTATDYTLYNVQGSDSQGAMSQDATTKAISAQTGYYTCGTAAGTPEKVVTVESGNLYKRTLGGHFKVQMTNKNTAASGVTLQIGSETAAALWYNGAAVSASNTWDAGEVISVYYDGTYYQASNAQGGGNSTGKKVIVPSNGVYSTNDVATQGALPVIPDTSGNNGTLYRCAKYAINEGDVLLISGAGSGYNGGKLWAFGDANGNYMYGSETSGTQTTVTLVAPAGAKWIILNSKTSANIEWYYAKAGSTGAHEILADTYLYGDLRTLAVGQTYYLGESIKTEDKQLLKITKEILKMNDLDEVSIGDIRAITSGTYLGTYQALKNVKIYTDTSYAENDYAIGRPAGAVINVAVDSETISSLEEATSITVTIAGIELTVTVDSTMDATEVATAIFTAFGTQEEWKLTDNSDGTLTLISKVAKTSAPTISSSVGDTGITISFAENSAYAGSTKLSKYNGTTWEAVSLGNYAADTAMWANRDATWLSTISNGVVQQNSAQNEFNAREGTSEYWDFAISDKKGNVICIIKDGHIITKNFKSSDLRISVGDVANAAYAVSDVNGNMAFAITEDGHIVTKNFNSRLVSLESIALLDKIITLVTKFTGKTMAVVGDSISTYTGYTPSNWRVYYPSGNVNNVSLTFWHIVATTLGMTALNCSYSASSVAGDSTQTEVSPSHAQGECAGCSDVRIASLTRDGNTPDIVLITLGTNDYGNGRALGSWDEHSAIPSEGTIGNFSSAYALMLHKIKTALPNARIFCCTIFQRSFAFPTGTLSIRSYNDVIKNMADIFGCDVIDTYACGLNRYNIGSYSVDGTLHPNAAGHKLIAEKIITELIAKY